MQATYIVPGEPMALARARFGKKKVWDSQKQQKFAFGIHLNSQHQGKPLYTGPLQLDVIFYMPMPKKVSKKNPIIGKPHIYTPDLSNLIKFVEDAATGILFDDDCIIAIINAHKLYDNNTRTEFTVIELRENGKKENKS